MDGGAVQEPIALDAIKQSARAEPRPTTSSRPNTICLLSCD
jgi:hypothetical protein